MDATTEALQQMTERTVGRLEAELHAERTLTRKLWVAVAKMQQMAGIAYCWSKFDDVSAEESDEFAKLSVEADDLLDSVVSLSPVEPKGEK